MDSFTDTQPIEDLEFLPASEHDFQPIKKRKVGRPRKIPLPEGNDGRSVSSRASLYPVILNKPKTKNANNSEDCANEMQGQGGKRARLPVSQTKLPNAVKHRIVELFACFHTHSQVSEMIKAEHNLSISKSTLAQYDPQRVACCISDKLRDYYVAVRKRYVEDAKDVAISHQAHRLRRLETISDAALAAKDFGNAIKALEIAAKEMGGLMQAGNDKLTVEHRGTIGHVHATVAEARAEVSMRLAALAEKAIAARPAMPVIPSPLDGVAIYDVEEGEADSIIGG